VTSDPIRKKDGTMQVRVNSEYCKGCNLCTVVCPRKVFQMGEIASEKGYIQPAIVSPEKCPNFNRKSRKKAVCEICILTCPDQAITLSEMEVET
jgi:2-oxoglutarate ferredoxin oxidoreductase subunit delta